MRGLDEMADEIKRISRNEPIKAIAHRSKPEELLTVEDVAAMLGVSTTKVYRMIRAGQLEAVNLGRLYRITPRAYSQMLEELSGNVCGSI